MFEKIKNKIKSVMDSIKRAVDKTVNHPFAKPVKTAIETLVEIKEEATGEKFQKKIEALILEWEQLLIACATRIENLEIKLNETETKFNNLKSLLILCLIMNVGLVICVVVLSLKVFH